MVGLFQEIPKASDLQFLGVLAGIVLLGAIAIVCYFRYGLAGTKKDSNGNPKQETSGNLPPAEWEKRIQVACVAAIRAELQLPIETVKACVARIEAELIKQGESQTQSMGKLAEAVNKLAIAIAKTRGIAAGDD